MRPEPWFAPTRDVEDLIVAAYGAAVHEVVPQKGLIANALNQHITVSQKAVRIGFRPVLCEPVLPKGRPYDVLFIVGNDSEELAYALMVPGWRHAASTVVVLHDEIWPANTVRDHGWLAKVVSQADHIVTSSSSPDALYAMANLVGKPIIRRPRSIEVERFIGPQRERPLDVMGYGRRDNGQDQALAAWANMGPNRWYQHEIGHVVLDGPVWEYRASLGNKLNRSKAVVCNAARFDSYETSGEYGTRFIEAAASGCAFIGTFPKSEQFSIDFGHLPGLIPLALGADADTSQLDHYLADACLARRVAVEHRVHALRHHDSSHSVAGMMDAINLPVAPAVTGRIRHLASIADDIVAAETNSSV